MSDGSERGSDATTTLERGTSPLTRAFAQALTVEVLTSEGPLVRTLQEGASMTVGRDHPAQLVVRDPHLSREHARLSCSGGKLLVEDLGSKNGTFVCGTLVERAFAQPGDELLLGPVVVHVRSGESHEGAADGSLLSYERFRTQLRGELERARATARPLSVAIVCCEGSSLSVGRFTRLLLARVKPPEQASLHSPGTLALMFPELSDGDAVQRLMGCLGDIAPQGSVRAAVASFPAQASSAEELMARAYEQARLAATSGSVETASQQSRRPTASPVLVSKAMHAVYALVDRVAKSDAPVLVRGETGSGKELVARALHERSLRAGGPLRAINCGALPTNLLESILFGHERGAFTGADKTTVGAFEAARLGTLFLDEVGELSPSAQAALLRVLETKTLSRVGSLRSIAVDARVIAATHRNLHSMVREGTFRADLLYRLNTVVIDVPPLRERREEVAPLAEHFLAEARQRWGTLPTRLSDEAVLCLESHDWPGNVRELRNVVERTALVALGPGVDVDDLPAELRAASEPTTLAPPADLTVSDAEGSLPQRIREFEAKVIVDALERTGGNQRRAAILLQVPLRTLAYKMRTLQIRRPGERS